MTWHFKPFYIATNEGVREADLTNPEDAKAIKEYIEHQREKLNGRRRSRREKEKEAVRSIQALVYQPQGSSLPAETKGKTSLRGRCGGDHIRAGS
jgi:hypothetical protein